jgi:hypothetical protein
MSIKFVCSCGKHLRAREEMAARRSVCPACGAPVGVPSLHPTQRGTSAEPLSHAENGLTHPHASSTSVLSWEEPSLPADDAMTYRLEDGPEALPGDSLPADGPLDPTLVRLVKPRKHQRRNPLRDAELETRWYHFLLYAMQAWKVLLILAVVMTILTVALAFWVPELLQHLDESLWVTLLRVSPALVIGLLLAGFLAGPSVLVVGGVLYWLNCGELTFLDEMVLAELAIVAVGYWLLALLAVRRSGSLLAANPVHVAQLVERLRFRGTAAVLSMIVVLLAHGWLAAGALEDLHRDGGMGLLLLAWWWLSALFLTIFLFRRLGVWSYRTR